MPGSRAPPRGGAEADFHGARVNFILSLFKLGLYSLLFTINSLKAVLNTNQEGYTYKKLLKSSCYIKVL